MRLATLKAALLVLAVGGGALAARASEASAPANAVLAGAVPQWQDLKRRSDWVALERASRLALADLRSHGASPADVATATVWLADGVQGQGRYAEAESLYRQALAVREKALGQTNADTVFCMEELVFTLMAEGRYREAEPLVRQAVAISSATLAENDPRLARGENMLARFLRDRGYYADAEPHFRRALAIRQKALGPNAPETATSLNNLGLLLWSEGRFDEAEPLMRAALEIRETVLGPEDPNTALSLNGLALVVHAEGRYAEAEPLYRRALAINEAKEPEHPDTAMMLSNLGGLLSDEGRQAEITPIFRRALAIRTAALGADHPDTAVSMNNLAFALEAQGQHAEAEALYRGALAIDQRVLGEKHTATAIVLRSIGELLDDEGRYAEAEPLFRRAVRIDEEAVGNAHPDTADAHQSLAYVEEEQSKFKDATVDYRSACSLRSALAGSREQIGEAASTAKFRSSWCSTRLSLSLWGWAAQGGGASAGEHPDALRREAFVATQRAALSAAGEAMARSAALAAARSAGVGDQATAYENALVERGNLDQQFAKAAGEAGVAGVEHRAALAKRRAEVLAQIESLASSLKAKAPRYWDLRSPEPIDLAALQARSGPDATLLSDDEALLLFLTPSGKDKGIVFAVSKTGAAWARISLTGEELEARVQALRLPIERNYRAFDRQAAYALYQVLLGDAAIQAVIKDKPTLLFVPAGPLTSIPPGMLVTQPPVGGVSGDADQDILRATPWLLRSKAVALLPSVSSLRTLRELEPVDRTGATDPLLAFADPDFGGTGAIPGRTIGGIRSSPPRSYSSYYSGGHAIAEALHSLPPLPGTLVEGEALMSALAGRPGSLLLGPEASKAELMARNADGRLAKVRVLEFATHGLVAGAATWLTEPALALAAGPRPEDELLLASEASTLKLNADWVLLSACNTASPDAPEAEGLSGLSRAFFFAGARSLLVSHWRVRDDVAARLVPAILLAERDHPGLSRAAALQQASLAILDDPTIHGAHPSAWAPFTLIGEAER